MAVGEETIFDAGDKISAERPADDICTTGGEPVVLSIAGLAWVGETFTAIMPDIEGVKMGDAPTP
jgi:hypothetical protein